MSEPTDQTTFFSIPLRLPTVPVPLAAVPPLATTTTRLNHHPGITCDECGVSPIVGTRYKATHLYDYDVCTACFQDHVTLLEKKEKKNIRKKNLTDDEEETKETKTWTDPITNTNKPPGASSSFSSSASSLFVAFPHAVDRSVSRLVCQVPDNSLRATSLTEAADKIGRNRSDCTSAHLTILYVVHHDNETEHSTAQEANDMYSFCRPCDRSSPHVAPIAHALAINTYLTQLHIHICWETSDCTNAVVALAQGMSANTSLERVFWHIGKESRNAVTAAAIRNMIVTNTTIAALYIGRDCFGPGLLIEGDGDEGENDADEVVHVPPPRLWGLGLRLRIDPTRNNPASGALTTRRNTVQTSNQFASIIFEGLKHNTTLRILRLGGYHVLSSNTTLEGLLDIVQHENRTIGKVYADFNNFFHNTSSTSSNNSKKDDSDTISYDHRLDLLLACNREQWIERFANTDATRQEQLDVLWEAIHYNTTNSNNYNNHLNDSNATIGPGGDSGTMATRSVFWDPVATAFHLLRSRPDFMSVV